MAKLAYTPAEAAAELGISLRRVEDAIRDGEVYACAPRRNGKQAERGLVIIHEDLIEWRNSWRSA